MPKQVLYIENDKVVTDSFQECIRKHLHELSPKAQIKLVVARHKDGAIQLLGEGKPDFDALIVDLMLPRNAEDLAALERLELQRRELVRQHFRRAASEPATGDEEAVRLRKQIDMLDREIEEHVASDGGYEILEWFLRKRNQAAGPEWRPVPLELPVILLTARGLPEVNQRCGRLVNTRYYRFFEKPVMEVDVLQALLDLPTTP